MNIVYQKSANYPLYHMEEKNQVFNIPLEKYEEDIDPEKKKEIHELFINHNKLRSQQELDEVDPLLRMACNIGYLEPIEIYLSETIENESNDMKFKINKTNKTASLFKINNKQIEHLIVPRTVKHESDEYLVTSICWLGEEEESPSKIKTIKFEENSSVNTIYQVAFAFSNVEEIYFPNSLIRLDSFWCVCLNNLKKIII